MTNILGSRHMAPGGVTPRDGVTKCVLCDYVTPHEIDEGLVGGFWIPEALLTDDWKELARQQNAMEENAKRDHETLSRELFYEECLTVADAIGRYLALTKELAGKKRIKPLLEIAFQGTMPRDDFEKLESWLKRFEEKAEDDTSQVDAETYARGAMSGIVTRKDREKVTR